jgi:hypothetical protein
MSPAESMRRAWERRVKRVEQSEEGMVQALKERLADLASQSGQRVDEFVEGRLRRIADADVRFERGVPVFPRRPGAPTLSVEDVDRLADGAGE